MRNYAYVYTCDRCGSKDVIETAGNQMPKGWEGYHGFGDLCPECAGLLRKSVRAFNKGRSELIFNTLIKRSDKP